MPIAVPDYKAPSWCPGAHLQTVIPAKFMPRPTVEYRREKVELPDGDFMLWDWVVPEPVDPAAPCWSISTVLRAQAAAIMRRR